MFIEEVHVEEDLFLGHLGAFNLVAKVHEALLGNCIRVVHEIVAAVTRLSHRTLLRGNLGKKATLLAHSNLVLDWVLRIESPLHVRFFRRASFVTHLGETAAQLGPA